jgi:imidazolonepropionase-like amidohydrolase
MLVLRDVRVVDGRGVRAERADVLLRDGRIAIISETRLPGDATAGAEIFDVPGRTIVPGLMNAHSHICLDASPDPEATLRSETQSETAVRGAARLLRALQSGVTSIRDVGAPSGIDIALKRLVDRGDIPGPRMVTAGRNITMTGGHGNWMGIEADGPEGVRHAARRQIKAGATAIKIMATGGMMRSEEHTSELQSR